MEHRPGLPYHKHLPARDEFAYEADPIAGQRPNCVGVEFRCLPANSKLQREFRRIVGSRGRRTIV
jgi:hypothetical protein